MARIIKIGIAALTGTLGALTMCLAPNALNKDRLVPLSEGQALSIKAVSFTNADLKKVVLEDYVIQEGKTDKEFSLPLPNGAYIDGAIIFNDCDYQYVGATLGDAFGLHNAGSKPNAYNFNVLFSFEYIAEMGIDADVYSYNTLASERSMVMVKFAIVGSNFYQALESTSYGLLTSLAGSSDFYANGADDYNYKTFALEASHTQKEVFCQPRTSTLNLAAFQFTYHDGNLIDNGNEITCTINSLSFEYSCN